MKKTSPAVVRTPVLGALAWFLAAALPAQASDQEQVLRLLPLSLEELFATPVVTASRRNEGREQTPAHILVFTREQLDSRRYKNLADLLEDLPGVDFQRGTRSSIYNQFSFQGQVSNVKLIIMLDGVRIDNPAGGVIPIAENFSLHFAKQVEVLYGPAAALYGADALAGVINIITQAHEGNAGGKLRVSRGSFNSAENSAELWAPLGEESSITLASHRQHSDRARLDQYYPGAFPKVDAKTFTGTVVTPAARREDYTGGPVGGSSDYLRMDIGRQFAFGYYYNQFHNPTSTGDTAKYAYYLADAQYITNIKTLYGKLRFDLADKLSGELIVDQSEMWVDPNSRYYNIYTDFQNDGYSYSYSRRRGIEQNFTWQADENNVVQAGFGAKRYYAIETPDLPQPYNLSLGPNGQNYFYPNTTLPIRIFDASYNNTSAYVQWQSQWTPTWSTTAGLRYDHHSGFGTSLNPRLGVVWQNVPGSFLKLLYGESFRAPSPDEYLNAYGSFSGLMQNGLYVGTSFRSPNFRLQPEKSRELSLTWDWRARPNFNLITNAYYTRVSNVIVTESQKVATQYIPGAILSNSTIKGNDGVDHYYGLDVIPQWRFALGALWNVDLWGSYSYQQGHIREADGSQWDQSYIANNKLKLGATFNHLDRFSITARVLATGPVNTGRKLAGTDQRIQSPGYAVANLTLGLHNFADRHLSAYVDIYNLFDRRYYAAHGSASTTFVQMPQQPRTLSAGIEYKF